MNKWTIESNVFLPPKVTDAFRVAHEDGDNFSYLIYVEGDEISQEQLNQISHLIKSGVEKLETATLVAIKEICRQSLSNLEGVKHSFSMTVLRDSVIYLACSGGGGVFIERDKEIKLLVSDNHTASGQIKPGDRFYLSHKDEALVSNLSEVTNPVIRIDMKSDSTLISEIPPVGEVENPNPDSISVSKSGSGRKFILLKPEQKEFLHEILRSKKINLIIVIGLLAVLIWSVGLGYERRERARISDIVEEKSISINASLEDAGRESEENTQGALVSIASAKAQLGELKEQIGDAKFDDINDLEEKIGNLEKKIRRLKDGNVEVFYELSLAKKGATATLISRNGSELILIDPKVGSAIVLSLPGKSAKTYSGDNLKEAIAASSYEGAIYSLKRDGVYRQSGDGKPTKLVESSDWGKVVDMEIYGDNAYLLDQGKGDIHRYISRDEKFASAESYFRSGQRPPIGGLQQLTIDGSVFIANKNNIMRYTSGLRDGFTTALPDGESLNIDGIFASPETNSLYVLDRNRSAIVILDRSGTYQGQVVADLLKEADGFVVLEGDERALVLSENSLYSLSL